MDYKTSKKPESQGIVDLHTNTMEKEPAALPWPCDNSSWPPPLPTNAAVTTAAVPSGRSLLSVNEVVALPTRLNHHENGISFEPKVWSFSMTSTLLNAITAFGRTSTTRTAPNPEHLPFTTARSTYNGCKSLFQSIHRAPGSRNLAQLAQALIECSKSPTFAPDPSGAETGRGRQQQCASIGDLDPTIDSKGSILLSWKHGTNSKHTALFLVVLETNTIIENIMLGLKTIWKHNLLPIRCCGVRELWRYTRNGTKGQNTDCSLF